MEQRRGDVSATEKVICSPWAHPSGIQQHKPNLSQHQLIINPHTWLYWKNLMNARLQKQYCNTVSNRNILDLQSISFSYATSTAYHKYNLSSESGFIFTCARTIVQKAGGGWGWGGIEDVLMRFFKCGSFSLFFLQIKAAINKPVTKRLWFTYPRPAMFRVPLSSSLLRTRWLAVCTLLAANIKDAHTELISRGHLYNNTFARSQWCSFWLGAAAHSAICLEYGDFFLNSLWMLCI